MANSLINWVLTYPKRFIFFILLITLAAGCFIYKNISINTSNTDLLSEELTFRKNDIAFTKEFPQFSNNMIVVIDAKKSDIAKGVASKIYRRIIQEQEDTKWPEKESNLYNYMFYPEEEYFFKKNGLLFLSVDELEEKLDNMARYQPFISRLASEDSLYNFLNTINLFLSADLSDENIEKINRLFEQLSEKKK